MAFPMQIRRRHLLSRIAVLSLAGAVLAAGSSPRPGPELVVAAESHSMVWNGVVSVRDRVFVAGPRWTGSKGPSVALARGNSLYPYPDAQWNSWSPGGNAAGSFVNVNSIHLGPDGALWVVDTGSPDFGGDPLPGGAKLVKIDLASNKVIKVYSLPSDIAQHGSYVDDVRFNGRHAYLTDAGKPGLIVLDLETGTMRRVLDGHASVTAEQGRDIILSGRVLRTSDSKPLHVNSDPFEVSPDGRWLYYAPLEGPWSRIPTRVLDDPSLTPAEIEASVEPWADLPPTGGTVMDKDGSLYFSDLATNAVKRRAPNGTVTTIVQDDRLHWVDAPFLDAQRRLWLPVPQMDRSPNLIGADRPREWPVRLFYVELPK